MQPESLCTLQLPLDCYDVIEYGSYSRALSVQHIYIGHQEWGEPGANYSKPVEFGK